MKRDGEPIRRTTNTPVTAETGYKDQNSSIHLLEALTALYEVWKDPLVRERLQEMLFLIRDTIITRRGNLGLFFTVGLEAGFCKGFQPRFYSASS